MYRTKDITGIKFGQTHDMSKPCPLPAGTLVRVRVAGLNQAFVGKAEEFHWVAPEYINRTQPWLVDTALVGVPENCALARVTVAEYEVLTEDQLPTYPPV